MAAHGPATAGRTIVFCATQRTGSTMMFDDLCRVMGEPYGLSEDLYDHIVKRKTRLSWPHLWADVSARNMVAGFACIKIMFHYTPKIAAFIAGTSVPRGRCLAFQPALFDPFAAFFREAVWVHVTRQDVHAQAVSMYLAEATSHWHSYAFEPPRAEPEIPYDYPRLRRYFDDFVLEGAQWGHFFGHYGITPVVLDYAAAAADYPAYLAPLLATTGLKMRQPGAKRRMVKVGSTLQAEYAQRLEGDLSRERGTGEGRPSFLKKRSKKLLFLRVNAGERAATAIQGFLVPAGRAPPFFKFPRRNAGP
jgi:LPS sulfotransferase NodH